MGLNVFMISESCMYHLDISGLMPRIRNISDLAEFRPTLNVIQFCLPQGFGC